MTSEPAHFRSWRRALLLGLLAAVCVHGLDSARRDFAARREHKPPMWTRERYRDLPRHLTGVPEAAFRTDVLEQANLRLLSCQYAAAPTAIVNRDNPAIMRRLLDGYAVVCDFRDPALLDLGIAQLREWSEREGVEVTVTRMRPDLAVLRSRGQAP